MWRLVYIVGDTEFFRRPETKTVENLDDLDDSSDDSPQVKYDGSWSAGQGPSTPRSSSSTVTATSSTSSSMR
jgi:hypothetical protein